MIQGKVWRGAFGGWLRKPADPDALLPELERLAETAPHLLADIGFCEERKAGHSLWRRGPFRVIVTETRTAKAT